MIENIQIQSEYEALKAKTQNRIKELENQCKNSQFVRQKQFPRQKSSIEFSNPHFIIYKPHSCCPHLHFCNPGHHHHHCQTDRQKDFMLNEVLMENLKAQESMKDNIKSLTDKMSEINLKKTRRGKSSEKKNYVSKNVRKTLNPRTRKDSLFSEIKRQKLVNTCLPNYSKRFKTQSFQYPAKKQKQNQQKKHKQNEYYQETKKKTSKKRKKGQKQTDQKNFHEVYFDGKHRTRNHERKHLVSAFKLQQMSRKKVAGIVRKSFSKYYGLE